MPPGFMNATTAPPKCVGAVATSCASAIEVAERRLAGRGRHAADVGVVEPTTRLAIGVAIGL